MSEHVLHTIYWDDLCADVYMYGSDIRFYNDRSVYFENLMMPSGMTIKKWMSSTVYQAHRIEPSLPMLTPGKEYILRAFYDEEPSGTVFLRFDFFNQQKKKTGTYIMDGRRGIFTCPANTYSYTAELVQGGSDRLRFYRFEIFAARDTLFDQITEPYNGEAILNFLVPSTLGHSISVFDEEIPEGMTDYVVLSPFLQPFTAEELDSIMKQIAPAGSYDGLCVYMQDENLYKNAISRGWQTKTRQFRLWKAVEDE